ncbi:hypothetical protein COT82_01720 [Candidatus Campbellbacteria bacterium CG10_big_fil_rev_8_21_14_0_10_35_52]|uniref:Uncharacterized protein n=1 Tax=Candidatus Campbellbacteria bacterium CG10_big_fil_rev_8_21_14_0_10_35_52 TaxID=1974527 RepID=A0A2M6WV69_9BACT|nr:MAG: hypothetical protein COT82_01720 [Candidatus Campbellbacteria bacterium CG10_big_fil_rev_8_21_14_0_10_35_52]
MTALEPTLSKIPEQRKPPRRRSLTLAPSKKSFVCGFDFARDHFFLLKGKQNFSLVFYSERAGGGCGLCFISFAGKNFLSLTHSTFCPLAETEK